MDDLYTTSRTGTTGTRAASTRTRSGRWIVGAVVGMVFVFVPALHFLGAFAWFIGVAVGGGTYWWLMRRAGAGAARAERARFKAAQA